MAGPGDEPLLDQLEPLAQPGGLAPAVDPTGGAAPRPAGGAVGVPTPLLAALGHARFTERERAGAEVFRARCAGCHAARLVADDPGSEVPFERWEPLVLSAAGPIVWSNAAYAKTGVEPYVNDRGARVAPLRRLYKKWPLFTSGSARSLGELLDRFAWTPDATYHDGAPAGPALARLTAEDRAALLTFLDLL
jgi:hypothetical protein